MAALLRTGLRTRGSSFLPQPGGTRVDDITTKAFFQVVTTTTVKRRRVIMMIG